MFSLQLFIDQCQLVGVALESFQDACYFDPTFHHISFHNMFEMCFFFQTGGSHLFFCKALVFCKFLADCNFLFSHEYGNSCGLSDGLSYILF